MMDYLKYNNNVFSPLSDFNSALHSPPSFANAHPNILLDELSVSDDDKFFFDDSQHHLNILQFNQQQLLLNRQFQQQSQSLQQSQQQQDDLNNNGPSINNRKLGLYKTELCRSWEEKGTCRYGNKCQFAHGEEELRNVRRHPKVSLAFLFLILLIKNLFSLKLNFVLLIGIRVLVLTVNVVVSFIQLSILMAHQIQIITTQIVTQIVTQTITSILTPMLTHVLLLLLRLSHKVTQF